MKTRSDMVHSDKYFRHEYHHCQEKVTKCLIQ